MPFISSCFFSSIFLNSIFSLVFLFHVCITHSLCVFDLSLSSLLPSVLSLSLLLILSLLLRALFCKGSCSLPPEGSLLSSNTLLASVTGRRRQGAARRDAFKLQRLQIKTADLFSRLCTFLFVASSRQVGTHTHTHTHTSQNTSCRLTSRL